jgi:hypothetical protein
MSQFESEHFSDDNGTRKTLWILVAAIIGVIILFMLYSHLPRANANNGTFSDAVTPVPAMTNPVGSVTLNRAVTVDGVNLTIQQVQQAGNFSDLRKHTSPYTLRIYLQAHNGGQEPIGINFSSSARLLLPDGNVVAPKLISVSPVTMPKATQAGYLDFPLQNAVPISELVLRFDNNTNVPLTAK